MVRYLKFETKQQIFDFENGIKEKYEHIGALMLSNH